MSSRFFRAALASLLVVAARAESQQPGAEGWAAVTAAMGRAGAAQDGGVMKYGFPRSDLDVRIDGVKLRPALALGSWAAFRHIDRGRVMVMGDLVLTEAEVQPVITILEQNDVRQSAVHNHLLGESPRIVYVHIFAEGDPARIAAAIRSALAATNTPAAAPAASVAPAFELDTALLHRTLGYAGKVNGGVYQISVPRAEKIRMNGMTVPPAMGVATAINFQPTGGTRAAITGDFVMRANEVGRIIPVLRADGISITALHSHMIGEEPRLYFMHFWANDDAARLAAALRRALNQMK